MSGGASDDLHWHLSAIQAILTTLLLGGQSAMLYGNFEASVQACFSRSRK